MVRAGLRTDPWHWVLIRRGDTTKEDHPHHTVNKWSTVYTTPLSLLSLTRFIYSKTKKIVNFEFNFVNSTTSSLVNKVQIVAESDEVLPSMHCWHFGRNKLKFNIFLFHFYTFQNNVISEFGILLQVGRLFRMYGEFLCVCFHCWYLTEKFQI